MLIFHMSSIGKSFALILVLIIVISGLTLTLVKTVSAQLKPIPTVPTFTVHLVGPPTVVNTTYSLDPNTGLVVAKIGYTNKYSAIVLTIENQPFNPSSGSLYYNVQVKNQNTPNENWTVVGWNDMPNPEQTSGSEYTNITLFVEGFAGYPGSFVGTQTDIQVQAMLGSFSYGSTSLLTSGYIFVGVTSGWSKTETVSVPANVPLSPTPAPSSSTQTLTSTPSPTSTPTPVSSASNTLLLLTITVALIVIAFLLAIIAFLLLYVRKRKPINLSQ